MATSSIWRSSDARERSWTPGTAAAATDAALIPSGFVYYATYDAATDYRTNRVFSENNGHTVTVAPPYRNTGDPRVPVTDAGRLAADEQTALFLQGKYADGSAPIVVGSYTEAQLILAEATGGSAAISILNSLRASDGLSPLASSSDPAVVTADIAQERARWLWLQGTHLYDVRRLGLPLVPASGLPYSITYSKGGDYGTETCMPIPAVETNNYPTRGSAHTVIRRVEEKQGGAIGASLFCSPRRE